MGITIFTRGIIELNGPFFACFSAGSSRAFLLLISFGPWKVSAILIRGFCFHRLHEMIFPIVGWCLSVTFTTRVLPWWELGRLGSWSCNPQVRIRHVSKVDGLMNGWFMLVHRLSFCYKCWHIIYIYIYHVCMCIYIYICLKVSLG